MTLNAGHLPRSVTAGESIWVAAANTAQSGEDITFADYAPSGGYTLSYQFAASTPITVAAIANGADTGWTLEVTAAQTLVWNPTSVAFAGYVTHTATGRVFAVDAGLVAVVASPIAVSSWAAALADCKAAIASYATSSGKRSISMDGSSITYNSMQDLTNLYNWLQAKVNQDTGNRPRRIIRSRFT